MSTVLVNLTDDSYAGFIKNCNGKFLPSATITDHRRSYTHYWRGPLETFLNERCDTESKFIIYLGVMEQDENQDYNLLSNLIHCIKYKHNVHICFINAEDIYDAIDGNDNRVNNFIDACRDIHGSRLEFVFNNTDIVRKFSRAFPDSVVTFYSRFLSRFFENVTTANTSSTRVRNKHFLCLNNRKTPHRDIIYNALTSHNAYLSYRARNIFLNEDNPWNQSQKLYLTNNPELIDADTGDGLAPDPNQYWHQYQDILSDVYYIDSCVYICTETLFAGITTYHNIGSETVCEIIPVTHWWTEKLLKSFFYKLPVIVVGLPCVLESVKSLGFKTFDCFWDESYDTIYDPDKRMQKILQLIDDISTKSISELNAIYYSKDMQDILNHNQHLMISLNDKYKDE